MKIVLHGIVWITQEEDCGPDLPLLCKEGLGEVEASAWTMRFHSGVGGQLNDSSHLLESSSDPSPLERGGIERLNVLENYI